MTKTCSYCGKEFETKRKNQRRCGRECARLEEIEKHRINSGYYNKLTNKRCMHCDSAFDTINPHQKYCNNTCSKNHQIEAYAKPAVEAACDCCSKVFAKSNKRQRFCNVECSNKYQAKKYTKNTNGYKCEICGKTFIGKGTAKITCSKLCREVRQKSYKVYCISCGKPVYGSFHITKNKYLHCSACKEEKIAKETAQMESVTTEIRIRTEKHMFIEPVGKAVGLRQEPRYGESLKHAIKDRDGWQCYICCKETDLHVHHIIPRKNGGSNTPENLVTLCSGCHKSIESGNVNNAIEKCVLRAIDNS